VTSDVRAVAEAANGKQDAALSVHRPWLVAMGGVLVALAFAALALIVAFQTHPVADIAVGDSVQDGTLVRDFNTPEVQPASSTGSHAYRWSKGESALVFPGIGRTAATVTLTMAGGPNPMPQPQVRLLANGGELTRLTLTPDFADYTVTIPAPYLRMGNLTLTLDTTPFRASGDRRELGVLVSRVRVVPAGGFALPPARPLLALWGAVALLTLALLVAGLSGGEAAVAAVLVSLAVAAGLVVNRLFVTVAASAWLRVGIAALLLALVLRLVMPRVVGSQQSAVGSESSGTRTRPYRWLLAVAVAVFSLRLGGLWHPAMIVSDLTFHVHRFEDVVVRHQWYQEIPALYASGRPVPYPPAAYLLFAPFAALVPDHAALLTLGTQLLDSSRVVLVGMVAWRLTGDRVAGACAAFVAGMTPIAFLLFSWGNLTDATGEVALTVVFALLTLAWPRLREPRFAVAFVVALLFTLLAHIGVAVTAVAFIGMTVALGLLAVVRGHIGRGSTMLCTPLPIAARPIVTLVALSLVAAVLAVALFYRVPLTGAKAAPVSEATSPVVPRAVSGYTIGAPRPDATIGLPATQTRNPLVAVVGQLGEEAWAFYRVWPLLFAPVGVWLLRRRLRTAPTSDEPVASGSQYRDADANAALVLSAWLVGALVLLIVGVFSGQFVRYAVSALPAVSVGVGVTLAYGWQWRVGRVAVLALLALTAFATLVVWYGRITRTYHA